MTTIKDIQDEKPELTLITDTFEVDLILRNIGMEEGSYGGMFVDCHAGDYSEIWGFQGCVPKHYKSVDRLL